MGEWVIEPTASLWLNKINVIDVDVYDITSCDNWLKHKFLRIICMWDVNMKTNLHNNENIMTIKSSLRL